jgi:chromate transporter
MATVVELFLVFARAGLLAWGGGPSMIPLIRAEVVGHGWLTDAEFVEALAMGNALPGPIATKMSGYVGYKIAGWPGAVAATSGMAFPTVVLMLALASFYFRFRGRAGCNR